MDKDRIATVLEEIGILLELKGENPFKVRAYYNAARALLADPADLETLLRERRLEAVRGIGEAIAEKIRELSATGSLRYHQELVSSTPRGLLAMLRVPSLGPKKVRTIHERLGVESLADLEQACRDNRIAELPGFGVRSQEKILKGLEYIAQYSGYHLYGSARIQAQSIVDELGAIESVARIETAGSVRRAKEIVHDVDLVCATSEPTVVMQAFVGMEGVSEVLVHGPTRSSVCLGTGLQVDLRAVLPEQYPFALCYFTGSKEHNTALRARARRLDLKLNEYGLFRGESSIQCATEADIYRELGLDFVPPELREDQGEIDAAEQHALPRLVEPADLKGVLHCHTEYSDGTDSIQAMATAARALGLTYLGVTDHSASAAYAGGLDVDVLRVQWDDIDALNLTTEGFRILKGIESDILPDGSLDYPDEILARFDFVIGSVHSSFQLDRAAQTQRVLRALENPYLTILGHPTGRLLLDRQGYDLDLETIVDAAAQRRVVIEFNANSQRLDLDWRLIRRFVARGGMVSINPDAHHVAGLGDVIANLPVARKGWLEAGSVLNCLELDRLLEWLALRRMSSA